jgi:hypothetical protein
MHPDNCLTAMLDATCNGERGRAYRYAKDLLDWLDNGGFPPSRHTVNSARALAVETMRRFAADADSA